MLRVTCQAGDGDAVTRPGLQTQRRPAPLAVTAVSGDSWVSGRGRACCLAAASLGARAHVGFCGDGVAAGGARFGSATGRGPPGGVAGRRGRVAERTRGKQHGRRTARPHAPAARPALTGAPCSAGSRYHICPSSFLFLSATWSAVQAAQRTPVLPISGI